MLAGVKARSRNIKPRCTFKRTERPGLPGEFVTEDLPPNPKTRASFLQYQVEQIAADIKESICRTSDLPFDEVASSNLPTVSYELPDGQEIHIGPDRFKVPEVLFNPSLIRTYADVAFPSKGTVAPLHELVLDSINRCDVSDPRRTCFSLFLGSPHTSSFSSSSSSPALSTRPQSPSPLRTLLSSFLRL
jgi:actin-like protein 6A